MLFGQVHATTAGWFDRHLGRHHSIPLIETPHVAALAGDTSTYLDYLRHSWQGHPKLTNTAESRAHQLERFLDYATHDFYEPITIARRYDGRALIVDGTHRAAIHHADDATPGQTEISSEAWILRTIRNTRDRYGTKSSVPYATIHDPTHRPLITGRRDDMLRRHRAIPFAGDGPIVDLGCNIGAGTLLAAWQFPHRRVIGYDRSRRHITAALRLADYFATDVEYHNLDLKDLHPSAVAGATVLALSILAHVDDLTGLRQSLPHAKVVYIEDHAPNHSIGLVADLFTTIRRIHPLLNRPLYECTP